MKVFFKLTLVFVMLLTVVSCGDDDDNENSSHLSKHGRRKCEISSKTAAWRDFVENVKDLNFADSYSYNCQETSYTSKLLNVNRKGIFYFYDGTTYHGRFEKTGVCTSGPLHEKYLIDLVSKTPTQFEAEFCNGKMVTAKIALPGKGKYEPDHYYFNFEQPASFNPYYKREWRDADRRTRTTVRQ